MLQFVIAGLVLGGIYAIASAGLVITYDSSGILNFAFGAMAFFIARLYYYLHIQQNWSILAAAVVSICVAGPALGVLLYAVLFRLPAPVLAAHQGGGDHRVARGHPGPGHADLRGPGHRLGARAWPPSRSGCSTSSGCPSPWTRSSSTAAWC